MKNIIIITVVAIFLTGCLGSKKTTERITNTVSTDSVSVKKDSIRDRVVNQAINDEIRTQVSESNTGDKKFDSLVNSKVDEILSKLNTQKRSGDNSYRFYYDSQLRELRALIELGETQNESTLVNEEKESKSTEETTEIEKVKKIVRQLPWWIWVILVLVFQKQIAGVVSTFIPGVATTKLYERIMK